MIRVSVGDGRHSSEIQLLRILGLFDRPADPEAISALMEGHPIPGITEAFADLATPQRAARWNFSLRRLQQLNLVNGTLETDGAIDTHPLVREHFAAQLRAEMPESYRAAHSRLYDHYRVRDLPSEFRAAEDYALFLLAVSQDQDPARLRSLLSDASVGVRPNGLPPSIRNADSHLLAKAAARLGTPAWNSAVRTFLPETIAGMETLFEAISHGCAADRHSEAFSEVYWPRILRGNRHYITSALGACLYA